MSVEGGGKGYVASGCHWAENVTLRRRKKSTTNTAVDIHKRKVEKAVFLTLLFLLISVCL